MDKTRDLRRGASRFSPVKRQIKQSGRKLFSGLDGGSDVVLKEKLKTERVRKLSVVGRASSSYEDCEMGCFGSVDDDLQPQTASPSCSNKRFKLPKRFFDECNSVYHTPVPRKLRSAMKKRNRESISPPLPDSVKLRHALSVVESSTKNSTKKSNLDMKQGSSDVSPRRVVSAPFTKDEEEVVETLHALAEMFSRIESIDKNKLDGEFLEVKPSALPEAGKSSGLAHEVPKDIADSACPSATAHAANSSTSVEIFSRERGTVNTEIGSKPCVPEQLIFADQQFHAESDSVLNVNLQKMPLQSASEPSEKEPSRSFVNYGVSPQQNLDTGLKQPKQEEALLPERKPEIKLGPASHFGSCREQQHSIKEAKKDGLALWPGLSLSHGAEIHSPPLQSCAAKYPAWMHTPTCATRPGSFKKDITTETVNNKVSRVAAERKSRKRCATHVYISRLIQVLHISERKDRLPVQPNQLRPSEGLKQGIFMVVNNLNGVKNECSGVLSGGIIGGSSVEKNPNEARNAVLPKRLHEDQQKAVTCGAYAFQKHCFDFLSLSAGDAGLEANNSNNRAKNGLESLSQLPIPYFHSLAQNQTIMPFSLPQTRYSTSTYPDQLSPDAARQVSFNLPMYHGNQFCGTSQTKPPFSTKQQQQQLQQQQQIWAAQMAYRPEITSVAMPQFPSWQNGRQDATSLVPCTQTILPPSSSAMEVQGPKYIPISPQQQQQQQLRSVTLSLAPARVRRQQHQLSSSYEENGGGFRSGSMLPSQLPCSERL